MYDQNWYNIGDIIYDQVTLAKEATPLSDDTATAGISTEYSRGDHARPLNLTTSIPPIDFAIGSVCTTNYYARNDHSHPINVQTNASIISIVKGEGINRRSAFYARHDHIHPQQLSYEANVSAIKSIKTAVLKPEILCVNGDITTIDSKFSRIYNSSEGGYIRLCVFPIRTSNGAPYVQFQVQ
ncbi:MAG: hypothetical protein EZS28_040723 [Streblomastix strix]|uniref:Uncharacterized protein n=1 Tax=Streblomastix strix TaxID=222440 RepID=A0A5J4U0R3_9EUKA|nr:MAG: hypothetical protein EZS28_040723 [Streblomastix strix]